MARLKQRLADEEHPQGAAAAGSNVERLERIRGLRRQIAVGEQCARKFESRKAAVSTPGVTAAVVVAPNVNGAGRGVNAVGQAVNGSGQGVNGVGQGANGFGQGVNGVGQAVNGSGRGVIGAGRTAPGAEQGTNGVGTGVERGGQGVNGIGRGVIGAGEAASAANGSGLAQTAGCTWDEASSDSESEDLPILKDQRAPFHRGLTGAKKAVVKEGGEGTVIRLRLPKASVNAIPGGGVNGAKRTVAPDKTATGDESGVSAGGVKGSRVNGAGKKTSGVDRASGKKSINPSVNGASTDGARQGSPVVNGSAGLVIKLGSDGNTGSAKGAAVKGSSVNGDRGARVVTLGGVNRPGKGTSAPGAKKADMPPTSPESASKRTVAKMGGVGGTPNVPPTNEGTQGATQPGARPLPKKITIVRKGKANEEVEGVGRAVGGAEKPSRDAESGAAQQVAGEAKAPLKRDKKRKSLVAGSSANEGGGGEMGQPGNRGGKPGGPLLPRLDENGPPEKKLKVRFEKPIARPGNAGAFADAPPTLGETVGAD